MTYKLITSEEDTWTECENYPISVRQEWCWNKLNKIKPLFRGATSLEELLMEAEIYRDTRFKPSSSKLDRTYKNGKYSRSQHGGHGIYHCAKGRDRYYPFYHCGTSMDQLIRYEAEKLSYPRWDKAFDEAEKVLNDGMPISDHIKTEYANQQFHIEKDKLCIDLWNEELLNLERLLKIYK